MFWKAALFSQRWSQSLQHCIKSKLTGGEDRPHPTIVTGNNQPAPILDNNQSAPVPDNQNLKATIDNFFGARYVSLFVKEYNVLTPRNQADLLNLTGYEAKLLFESLGKNPSGDPGSIKVYQPGIAASFKTVSKKNLSPKNRQTFLLRIGPTFPNKYIIFIDIIITKHIKCTCKYITFMDV